MPGPQRRAGERSIAARILLVLGGLLLVMVTASAALAALDAQGDARELARAQVLATAWSVADAPSVLAALDEDDPSATLQPFAEQVRRDTGVDFVVVMALDRTRYSHPDPDRIGGTFLGDLGGAPQGRAFSQEYVGTLGPSVRAVVPVRAPGVGADGTPGPGEGSEVLALVAAGITVDQIDAGMRGDLLRIGLVALVLLGLGYLAVRLVVRRLRRETHGLGAREIARIYEYHHAVLHAVREGLLLLDADGVVQLANDEARRLLDLPADVTGRPVDSLDLPSDLVRAVTSPELEHDDVHVVGGRVLLVSSSPATSRGREVGAVVTLRDRTELQEAMGELDVVRGLTESLRAQQHEAANRLHTMVSLIETGRGEQAVEFATGSLRVAQQLTDRVVAAADDPVVGALLLAKLSEAAESGIELEVVGTFARPPAAGSRDLVTILGNLIDNAFDAVADQEDGRVRCELGGDDTAAWVSVGDNGPGTGGRDLDTLVARGWSTKTGASGPRGIGLALVSQSVRRLKGRLELGRSPWGGAQLRVVLPTAPTGPDVP